MVNYRKHTPSPFHGYVVQILDLVSPSTNFIGMCMCLAMSNSATLWTVAHQAPLSIEFPRQEYWRGLPLLPLEDLPDTGIKASSFVSPALAGGFFTNSAMFTNTNQLKKKNGRRMNFFYFKWTDFAWIHFFFPPKELGDKNTTWGIGFSLCTEPGEHSIWSSWGLFEIWPRWCNW